MRRFEMNRDDRILDGAERPEGYEEVGELLDDLRLLRTDVDPDTEVETVRAMKNEVERSSAGKPAPRHRRFRRPVAAAIAFAAVALAGTASAAVEGSPVSIPGVPTAEPGKMARAVLTSLGIQQRTDEEDAEADRLDREKDAAEREAEAAERQAEAQQTTETQPTEPAEAGPAEPAKTGMETAKRNAEAATAFAKSMQVWAACVASKAPLHKSSEGAFDPVAACGPKPTDKGGLGTDDDPAEEAEDPERRGPPPTAGPPADAGPPPGVGPTQGSGPSTEPGPPPGAGPPPRAGPPPGVGPPGIGPGTGDDDPPEPPENDE
jgi:hypothetical protein